MKTGIRLKLLAIILLSSALPLALGGASLGFFGYRYYSRAHGQLYQSAATQLAHNISLSASAQIEKIPDWVELSGTAAQIRPAAAGDAGTIERAWPRWTQSTPFLNSILQSELSLDLKKFQQLNPVFTEIFVTDSSGLVVAATNKTSDYMQSDEAWWQKSKAAAPGVVRLEGISYDQSAQVHSLDIALALRDSQSGAFKGVIKAVINASVLFAAVSRDAGGNGSTREIVFADGRVLTRLFNSSYVPLSAQHHDLKLPSGAREGWQIAPLDSAAEQTPAAEQAGSPSQLIGFAPLQLENTGAERIAVEGLSAMTVLVREDASKVFTPIRNQLLMLGLLGGVLLTALSLIGLYIAERKIIMPLRLLGRAARGVAQTARLEENYVPSAATQAAARKAVQRCREINTGDEIETLADDFALMGERVLHYHEQLQSELAAKTGEIQRDLEMAREFQESLLPHEYPQLSAGENASPDQAALLRLQFHHVYQPALTVGGDFFDVFKLSDQQAGIFIADVMGHGARSALITAILRTLLQDLSSKSSDPATLMRLINLHFSEIMQGSRQFVFVSAFCLVIDAQTRIATYANAGHPSPLVANAASGEVQPLLGHVSHSGDESLHSNAALGLSRDTTYHCHSRPVSGGEAFLLFTDGVAEAPNAEGEEFGVARLQRVIEDELAYNKKVSRPLDVADLSHSTMKALRDWMQDVPSPDDICLVVVGTEEAALGVEML